MKKDCKIGIMIGRTLLRNIVKVKKMFDADFTEDNTMILILRAKGSI